MVVPFGSMKEGPWSDEKVLLLLVVSTGGGFRHGKTKSDGNPHTRRKRDENVVLRYQDPNARGFQKNRNPGHTDQ